MRLLIAAVLTYIAVSLYVGPSLPGLQFDEAIYEHGAVALMTGDRDLDFGREDRSWVNIGGHPIPFMVISYAGAAKFYLLILPYWIFGTAPVVGRIVSMLLGALGIFGIGRALQVQVSDSVGAAVALALAIHPEYVTWVLYDNAGTALWMANCGLTALAMSRFASRPSRPSAFFLGFAIGFAIWGRANFLWIIGGIVVGALFVFRDFVRRGVRFLPAITAGGIIGSAPLIVFELRTGFSTLRVPASTRPLDLIPQRLQYVLESLTFDFERIGIWGGLAVPRWQLYAFGAVVVAPFALLLSLRASDRPVRLGKLAVIAALIAYGWATATPLGVMPHHYAALLPLPVIAVAMAATWLARSGAIGRIVVAAFCVAYATFAITCIRSAHEGLASTRGVGMWSDAISDVSNTLLRQSDGRTVNILDWGLGNNLYVLTRGRVPFQELFWRADEHVVFGGIPWSDVVRAGGLFLLNAPNNTHFPQSSAGFQRALAETGAKYSMRSFHQANGAEYARLYDVEPPLH